MAHELLAEHHTSSDSVRYVKEVLNRVIDRVKRPAAVFDVDATLLFNNPRDDTVTANKPVVEFMHTLRGKGVDVFIVTARQKTNGAAVYLADQLERCGVHGYKKLYMNNKQFALEPDPSRFKIACRERIRDSGHTIVVNVGDKWTDHFMNGDNETTRSLMHPLRYYTVVGDSLGMVSLKLADHEP